jgi:hypothetical protein
MRWGLSIIALILASGCATVTYNSDRPASVVSECIAAGWKKSPKSGYVLPVSLTKLEQYYFVGVELHYCFSPLPMGKKHPTHPVWAEVRESASGSVTEYHRAYQIKHERIDRVVQECQESEQGLR